MEIKNKSVGLRNFTVEFCSEHMKRSELKWIDDSHSHEAKHSPQTMSKVHNVTYGKILKESLFTSVDSFLTIIALCSLKMSIKSSRILKWKAGVRICLGDERRFERSLSSALSRVLLFSGCATSDQNSSRARCQATDEDRNSQSFCRCA